MESNKTRWGALTLIAFIAVVLSTLVFPSLPKGKSRASRIQAVNQLASFSITLPSTNALRDETLKK